MLLSHLNKALIFCLIAFLSFSACNSTDGPCDYDIVRAEAEVKEIVVKQDGTFSVVLSFNDSPLAFEEVTLEDLRQIKIDTTFLFKNHIEIGNRYKTTVSTRVSGNCTKQIVSFDSSFK